MAMLTLYPAKVNSPSTTLSASIDIDDTTISVYELSCFPSGANEAVLGDGDDAETILYSGISGASGPGTITVTQRGFQGTAKEWPVDTPIAKKFTAYDYDAIVNNLDQHTHKLDDLAVPDDNTDLNASAASHGLLPKLSGDESQFLNGSGDWAIPDNYTELFEEDTGTLTLPSSPNVGQVYEIVGTGTAWTVNIPSSTYVRMLDVLVSTSVAGSTGYECATFIYAGTISTYDTWIIKNAVGELTLT